MIFKVIIPSDTEPEVKMFCSSMEVEGDTLILDEGRMTISLDKLVQVEIV